MTALRFMVIIGCITASNLEAAESGSAQQYRQNDDNKPQNVADYQCIVGMRWTDKHSNQWFIDSEGVPRPIRKFDLNPIEDPKRVSALVMMAQRNIPQKQRIPVELHEIIHRYCDYNEIRTLFQMFTSPEVNTEFFGFTNYAAMHWYIPIKAAKVTYLKSLGLRVNTLYIVEIEFNQNETHITAIKIRPRRGDGPSQRRAFNWDAVVQVAHLEVLQVGWMNIDVSMDDIRKLPNTLRELEIGLNYWTTASGDVDLSLLPRGLTVFQASRCRGMNGVLRFDAPNSSLVSLYMSTTDVRPEIDSSIQLPPSLYDVLLPRHVDDSVIQILKKKVAQV